MSDTAVTLDTRPPPAWLNATVLLFALLPVLVFAGGDALVWMVRGWGAEEYNYCWLVIPMALFMVATRSHELFAVPWRRSWAGLALTVAGLLLVLLGNLSAVVTLTQYGVIVVFWGLVWTMMGTAAVRIVWPALVHLVFLVPLPDFLEVQLSAKLQLVSSQLGAAIIRLAGLPVYLEGNIIDLGIYQLAVAEACSGLRYLFPLTSFGFLCAVIFVAPLWQRVLLFLSTIPITVLMNSLRIGAIGVLVNSFGTEHVEGFTHFFEGWVAFMLCVGILFAEMALMSRLSGRQLLRSLRMQTPPFREILGGFGSRPINATLVMAAVLVVAGSATAVVIEQRIEQQPVKPAFATFPLVIGAWRGVEQAPDGEQLRQLAADDTLLAVFSRPSDPIPVSLWIAYYGSQRQGRSVHSPRSCLPGGGWNIGSLERVMVDGVRADDEPLPVNRALIGREDQHQLVYYWFAQRGRLLTSEYIVKWYIFWDSLTLNRSDGALVRLVTSVEPGPGGLEAADARLRQFVRDTDPQLNYYLPQRGAVLQVARTD